MHPGVLLREVGRLKTSDLRRRTGPLGHEERAGSTATPGTGGEHVVDLCIPLLFAPHWSRGSTLVRKTRATVWLPVIFQP